MPDTTQQPWTIKRLLDWTESYFQQAKADSPRLEAEILLAEALECARIELYTRFDEVPDADRLDRFRDWIKRRAKGEPVAYIVGYREFYSLRFQVNEDVLIPRPETEHVVVKAIELSKSIDAQPLRLIDVGTGSGCIAVTLAKHLKNCKIAATDISESALLVARENATAHSVEEQVHFFGGDLFDALPQGSAAVHLIVSNPPYIGKGESGTVDPQVDRFEPHSALFAGQDGMEVIGRLVHQSPERLLPGGYLIFEISPLIEQPSRDLLADSKALELEEIVKDYAGHPRVVVCRRVS